MKVQNYYWRCISLLFESSRRLNPNSRFILFLNQLPPALVEHVDLKRLFQQLKVEIVHFPHITRPPPDYYKAWATQFIEIDILEWLAKNVNSDDSVFILDSDIIMNKKISIDLISCLQASKALVYTLDYPVDRAVSGLSRREMLQVAYSINPAFPADEFKYSGGEFLCLLGSEIPRFAARSREVYEHCLKLHVAGRPKFNEEAQLFSLVNQEFGYPVYSANTFVKRIWTDRSSFCNVDGSEGELIFWHLPAEKKRGFKAAFGRFKLRGSHYILPDISPALCYHIEEPIWYTIRNFTFKSARCVKRLVGR